MRAAVGEQAGGDSSGGMPPLWPGTSEQVTAPPATSTVTRPPHIPPARMNPCWPNCEAVVLTLSLGKYTRRYLQAYFAGTFARKFRWGSTKARHTSRAFEQARQFHAAGLAAAPPRDWPRKSDEGQPLWTQRGADIAAAGPGAGPRGQPGRHVRGCAAASPGAAAGAHPEVRGHSPGGAHLRHARLHRRRPRPRPPAPHPSRSTPESRIAIHFSSAGVTGPLPGGGSPVGTVQCVLALMQGVLLDPHLSLLCFPQRPHDTKPWGGAPMVASVEEKRQARCSDHEGLRATLNPAPPAPRGEAWCAARCWAAGGTLPQEEGRGADIILI